MTPERWQKLDKLFHDALEREPSERETFIGEACGADAAWCRELKSMLDHHEQTKSFIESPAYALAAGTLVNDEVDSRRGKAVGPYGIVGKLGSGG